MFSFFSDLQFHVCFLVEHRISKTSLVYLYFQPWLTICLFYLSILPNQRIPKCDNLQTTDSFLLPLSSRKKWNFMMNMRIQLNDVIVDLTMHFNRRRTNTLCNDFLQISGIQLSLKSSRYKTMILLLSFFCLVMWCRIILNCQLKHINVMKKSSIY